MSAALDIRGLSVSYGAVPALRGISLRVDEGEIVAMIGPNGAGKTTTMKAISGLLKASPASVFYNGRDITGAAAHKLVQQGIIQVPEGRGIFQNLTVLENINLGAYLRRDRAKIRETRETVFATFPRLKERVRQISGTLSGGEQQMLAIARAMMAVPKLLLLDEPSMGLAPIIVEDIFRIIKQINAENKTTILLVEQNAKMALAVSNRAYVIEVGQVVNEGASVLLRKDDGIRKAYLGI
ncbi:MAG: ABC transporter ATP-binding protein [Oscillospiraceae bacterium]|jgi:branched-chain amino acid transport system ATP-binding protein|nr:ABC transporter ATP-binding protein [Oscillospiraceae bacterium]